MITPSECFFADFFYEIGSVGQLTCTGDQIYNRNVTEINKFAYHVIINVQKLYWIYAIHNMRRKLYSLVNLFMYMLAPI